jgi:hypothetical protein
VVLGRLWIVFVCPLCHESGNLHNEDLAPEGNHCNGVPEWRVRLDVVFGLRGFHDSIIFIEEHNPP